MIDETLNIISFMVSVSWKSIFLRFFFAFLVLISVVAKLAILILFIDFDAELHVLKLSFVGVLCKIIRESGNYENKSLYIHIIVTVAK